MAWQLFGDSELSQRVYNSFMVTGVEFDEDKFNFGPRPGAPKAAGASASSGYGHVVSASRVPAFSQWLIDRGIVKSPGAAQGVLIAIVVVNLVAMYLIIHFLL